MIIALTFLMPISFCDTCVIEIIAGVHWLLFLLLMLSHQIYWSAMPVVISRMMRFVDAGGGASLALLESLTS
jgi:hypothetical protein